jgi:tRNA threonylcarbamoyladenosine biosynthesis protein TsaE
MDLSFELRGLNEAARMFWESVPGYRLFAFYGEMGSGKTTFIRALCQLKGIGPEVSSPTYSLIHEYRYEAKGKTDSLYHLDLFRIRDLEEAIRAGVEDCLYSGSICFIEWPEIIEPLFSGNVLRVYLSMAGPLKRNLVSR